LSIIETYKKLEQSEHSQVRHLKIRFAINAFFLVAALVLAPLLDGNSIVLPLLLLCSVGFASNFVSFLWIMQGRGLQYHIYFSTSVDVLLITIGVHYVGGIESTFSWVYVVILIAVALLHGFKAGIFVAIISSISYSGLLFAEFTGIIPHIDLGRLNPDHLHVNKSYFYAKLVSNYILFFATAAVSGYLARRLLQNRNELKEAVQKSTEELLKANERLDKSVAVASAALESTPDGILVVDTKGVMQSYNQNLLKMWSIPRQIMNSDKDFKVRTHMLSQAKYPKRVIEETEELYDHPEQDHFHLLELKDGRVFERYSKPQKIGDETVGRVISFRDISERRKAEELLQKSEQKYRTLFEESKDAIFISTPEGKILDINQAGAELFGYSSKKKFLNLNAADTYVSPAEREKYQQIMTRQGFVKDLELILRRKDGKELRVLVTANAVRDKRGNVTSYRGIMRDITEQKQLEQQFIQAQKMESLGTLAGGIAHDFNNILAGILGYTSLMKSHMTEAHPFFRHVEVVEKSATRAAELTSQLLGFARGGKVESRPLNLNSIVRETLGIIGSTFDKSIEIEVSLKDSLPTVQADAAQMQQVLMNLCVNAGDAMSAGGKLSIETDVETIGRDHPAVHIDVEAGSYVTLRVSDIGVGMDKETKKRIFEPFYTTKEAGKGTGLGLSMAYGVVKNHGGYIDVYSEPMRGTTFRIFLPVSGESEPNKNPVLDVSPGERELVLVVDDEEHILEFAKEVLESSNYRVMSANNGVEALSIFREYNDQIDLVILDMIMPEMGGHQTFLAMQADNPEVKALLSSGYSQSGRIQEILDSGAMGFIQKPYQPNALLSKVQGLLNVKFPA